MDNVIQPQIVLAPYTSFNVGGAAELFTLISSSDALLDLLKSGHQPQQVLGYGSNTLISDKGLPGLTMAFRGGAMSFDGNEITVDAGVWWDDVVAASVERGLWGCELMSEVPGSVGGAVFINITAYGQSIGPLVQWLEVWDPGLEQVRRLEKDALHWDYKQSIFQQPEHNKLVILRACLRLSSNRTDELQYQKAINVAEELGLSTQSLSDRRKIIIETRARAGSLWHPDSSEARTVGSFFRNPVVSASQLEKLMAFDESGMTAEEIKRTNRVHGGIEQRVSAAHVMLAAGFSRGQSWDNIKLNDKNLLKIEALPGATAQEIYDVAKLIQETCYQKLGIQLEPEARILGEFRD